MNKLFTSLLVLGMLHSTLAQDKKKEWNVSEPTLPFQETTITSDEGTWMSLDISPDGSMIVFDLLGDIYTLPITGGKATAIRTGHAFDVQPRFSPNGKQISFTSDAGGGDNIWVMNTDGTGAKAVTKETFRLLNNAVWSIDGNYLYARKHFSSKRSVGAGEIWMYHKSGGQGIQLIAKKNEQQDIGEPWPSSDGKYIYYSEDMYPGGYFQYNKDPNSQIYAIKRYDLDKGKIERVTGGSGGAIRPVVSHQGDRLAFIRRVREKTVLYLHDLKSGQEWPIYDDLTKDQQEAWAIFGPYTGFNWTPDDQHIIIWAKGKIRKINVSTLEVVTIPFEATATHKIVNALKFKNEVAPDQFTAKAIRQAVTSPDGQTLVFNAAGFLWKKTLPNGTPTRLTNGTNLEFEPAYSQDGKYLAFVTWNDDNMGAIHRLDMTSAKAKPVKLTSEKAIYREPSFHPSDRNTLVYRKEGGNGHQGYVHTKEPGLYLLKVKDAKKSMATLEKITDEGTNPSFNQAGNRIYYQTGGYLFGSLEKKLKSIKLDGTDKREIVKSKYAQRILPSPDERWVAYSNLYKVYIAAMPLAGKTLELDGSSTSVPVAQVAKDAGINLQWSSDSKRLNWTLGNEYFSNAINDRFLFIDGAPDSIPPMDSVGVKINLQLASDKPKGKVAFTNARIITMKGDEVITNGTVIVEENKIIAVGTDVNLPADAKIIDANGKTIMPGLVDVHAHVGQFRHGLSPQQHWQYHTNLAYGVTTTHDPSSNTEMVFSQSEMVKSGTMVGPRIFSTGVILYGADGDFKAVINGLEDARSAITRTKAFGAFSVKSYNQPRRDQRQQVIQAAHEQQVEVVPEGGSNFFHNLTMILDGHTGVEHNLPVAPLYDDVIQLWKSSKTGYTPTLLVSYGAVSGEYYWYQTTNVWEDEKLLRFTPRSIVDSRSRHRTMIPMKEYDNGHILASKSCKALTDAGVKVNLGAHGQLQGLGAHWELWELTQGGMTNMEALRAATMNGANYLGMDEEIGSIEVGKLADLIVLDKNPLENIQNSNSVVYTMINGRLYDANTMNEIGNYDAPRGKFYWEQNGYAPSFDWHGASEEGCSCQTGH
ncbi:amidohydrolase family protein [Reichenbachiella carrageenanivorans]|uniref:Amidohydrolase family protein n=1 Tax=Reichenbachiella carrageenanivorans TaxID=2979869 RepID=A0ABY6D2S3_9BACT|nr:amidohydrolase family protein [Reichenbachiella carrageenanivorans]UXX80451.1 amidohydrolase family protein [Reichenbachiella carrageenanivorans]